MMRAARPKNLRSWITLVLLTAVIGFGAIGGLLDLVFNAFRVKLFPQSASGDIVIVGVDEQALKRVGPWPWSDETLSHVTEGMMSSGAERVFFSMTFGQLSDEDVTGFAQTVKNYPGQIYLSSVARDDVGIINSGQAPQSLTQHAQTVSLSRYVKYWGGVETVSYFSDHDGQAYPALETELVGVSARLGQTFPIDYSIQADTLPFVSAADFLGDASPMLEGKDVIFALTDESLTNPMLALGQQYMPPAFIYALGAETLKNGRPFEMGWIPLWLLAAAASLMMLHRENWKYSTAFGCACLLTSFLAPMLLGVVQVFVKPSAAFLLVLFTTLHVQWKAFGRRERASGSINPMSGLQTINALRHSNHTEHSVVIAASVRRYTEIISALPDGGEAMMVREIVKRLSLCTGDATLMHGDDGCFYWLTKAQEAAELPERIQALSVIFKSPIPIAGSRYDVLVTFGVDEEFDSPVSQRCSNALAAARDAQKHEVCWKKHDTHLKAERAFELSFKAELTTALERGDIWVAFQPQICLKTNELTGCEALARWTHPQRGPVRPDKFVQMAELTGCIDVLTEYILDQSLRTLDEAKMFAPDLNVSVNLSPKLLTEEDLFSRVTEALDEHDITPESLILEITESERVVHNAVTAKLLENIRAHGVGLSIDDYGTGLSTLEYLRKIPGTELKIDRSFTKDIETNHADRTVIRSTIELAHALNMVTVVEGVETDAAINICRDLGADYAQGYGISRPLPAEDFINWIKNYGKLSQSSPIAC